MEEMTNQLLVSEDHKILGASYCSGYHDPYGKWNSGFTCPSNIIYCCGTSSFKYCCTTREMLIAEANATTEFIHQSLKTPITVALISGITLLAIFVTFVSCFFCSCCLMYKKRSLSGGGAGLYRIQQGSNGGFANLIACSPSSFGGNSSSVTTPLTFADNDWMQLITSLPGTITTSANSRMSTNSSATFIQSPSPAANGVRSLSNGQPPPPPPSITASYYAPGSLGRLRTPQYTLPRYVPPPEPPPFYIFNETQPNRRPLSFPQRNLNGRNSRRVDESLRQFYTALETAHTLNTLNRYTNPLASHRSTLPPNYYSSSYQQHINNRTLPNYHYAPPPPPPPPRSTLPHYTSSNNNINNNGYTMYSSVRPSPRSSPNCTQGCSNGENQQIRTISQVISIINSFVAEEKKRLKLKELKTMQNNNSTREEGAPSTNVEALGEIAPSTPIQSQDGERSTPPYNYPNDEGSEESGGGLSEEGEVGEIPDPVICLTLPSEGKEEGEEKVADNNPEVEISGTLANSHEGAPEEGEKEVKDQGFMSRSGGGEGLPDPTCVC